MELIFMRNFINEIKKDRITFNIFLFSFVIGIVHLIYVLINYKKIPPLIPIFNQLPWGNERLTQTNGIFIPIFLFLCVYVFNFCFVLFLYKRNNPLLGRIIASVTLLLSVVSFIFIVKTILLVV